MKWISDPLLGNYLVNLVLLISFFQIRSDAAGVQIKHLDNNSKSTSTSKDEKAEANPQQFMDKSLWGNSAFYRNSANDAQWILLEPNLSTVSTNHIKERDDGGNCKLYAASQVYDEFGDAMPEQWKVLANINLDDAGQQKVSLKWTDKYLQIKCNIFQHQSSQAETEHFVTVSSTEREVPERTSKQLNPPNEVKAYVSSRRPGIVHEVYSVTLEWSKIRNWTSRPLSVQSRCDFTRKNGTKISNTVYSPWFRQDHTHYFQPTGKVGPFNFSQVNCSIRGIAAGDTVGTWSPTVAVNLLKINPPPRLTIVYFYPPQGFVVAVIDIGVISGNISAFHLKHHQSLYNMKKSRVVDDRRHIPHLIELDATSTLHVVGLTSHEYMEHHNSELLQAARKAGVNVSETLMSLGNNINKNETDEIRNKSRPVYDFTYDWVSFVKYEVRKCKETDPFPRCIFVADSINPNSSSLFYESLVTVVVKQVVINPGKGILFWTETPSENKPITASRLKYKSTIHVHANVVDLTEMCSNLRVGLATPLLTIDWEYDQGRILVLNQRGEFHTIAEDCKTKLLSKIPLHQAKHIDRIQRIAVDWSYVYWLEQFTNKERKLQSQINFKPKRERTQSVFYMVNQGYALKSEFSRHHQHPEDLELTNPKAPKAEMQFTIFNLIADMKCFSAEARILPTLESMVPSIVRVFWNVTSKTTAQLFVDLKWPTNYRSPVTPSLLYRRLGPNDDGGTPCNESETECSKSLIEIARGSQITTMLTDIVINERYYLEVSLALHKATAGLHYRRDSKNPLKDVKVVKYTILVSSYENNEPLVVAVWAALLIAVSPFVCLLVAVLVGGRSVYQYLKIRWAIRGIRCIPYNELDIQESLSKDGYYGEVLLGSFRLETVAVKRLKEEKNTPAIQRDFLVEAICLSQFRHDNIVKIKGIVLNAPQPMIVMEYWEGGNAKNYLNEKLNTLPLERILELSIQLTRACAYLERQGFIHKDISLKNTLIREIVKPKSFLSVALADFGQVIFQPTEDTFSTTIGEIAAQWAAPETLVSPSIFSRKSDVYSLGVALWEIYTYGQRDPFHQLDREHFLEQRVIHQFKDPGCIPCFCPIRIRTLIEDCWSFDPENRPDASKILCVLEHEKRCMPKTVGQVLYEVSPEDLEEEDESRYGTDGAQRVVGYQVPLKLMEDFYTFRSSQSIPSDPDPDLEMDDVDSFNHSSPNDLLMACLPSGRDYTSTNPRV